MIPEIWGLDVDLVAGLDFACQHGRAFDRTGCGRHGLISYFLGLGIFVEEHEGADKHCGYDNPDKDAEKAFHIFKM